MKLLTDNLRKYWISRLRSMSIQAIETKIIDSWDGSVALSFAGGKGTSDDPYLITKAEHLALLAELVNNSSYHHQQSHYKLDADIDLCKLNWTPIGISPVKMFSGKFDGNKHKIIGLQIGTELNPSKNDYLGLFGYVSGADSQIKNITLIDGEIHGRSYIGSICGYALSCKITGCYCTVNISGTGDNIGGTAGYCYFCELSHNFTIGEINGRNFVGGLIGHCNTANIFYSFAMGTVSGKGYYIGGLVGYYSNGLLSHTFSTGIFHGCDSVGGLVGGYLNGNITHSYSTGSIDSSGYSVGALVGYNNVGTISNCYTSEQVHAKDYAGALLGYNYRGKIDNCYYDKLLVEELNAIGFDENVVTSKSNGLTKQEMTLNWVPCGSDYATWVCRNPDYEFAYYPQLAVFAKSKSDTIRNASLFSVMISALI